MGKWSEHVRRRGSVRSAAARHAKTATASTTTRASSIFADRDERKRSGKSSGRALVVALLSWPAGCAFRPLWAPSSLRAARVYPSQRKKNTAKHNAFTTTTTTTTKKRAQGRCEQLLSARHKPLRCLAAELGELDHDAERELGELDRESRVDEVQVVTSAVGSTTQTASAMGVSARRQGRALACALTTNRWISGLRSLLGTSSEQRHTSHPGQVSRPRAHISRGWTRARTCSGQPRRCTWRGRHARPSWRGRCIW